MERGAGMTNPLKEASHALGLLFGEFAKSFATGCGLTCGFLYGLHVMGVYP
jgi:hypothetical protein